MPVGNNTNETSTYTIRPAAPPPAAPLNPNLAMAGILVGVLVTAGGLLLEINELALAGVVLTLASLAFFYGQYLQARGAAEKCSGEGPFDLPAGKINLCPAQFEPETFIDFIVTTKDGTEKFEYGPINQAQPMVWLRYADRSRNEVGVNGSPYKVDVEILA